MYSAKALLNNRNGEEEPKMEGVFYVSIKREGKRSKQTQAEISIFCSEMGRQRKRGVQHTRK
jgi:hypothetical protein